MKIILRSFRRKPQLGVASGGSRQQVHASIDFDKDCTQNQLDCDAADDGTKHNSWTLALLRSRKGEAANGKLVCVPHLLF